MEFDIAKDGDYVLVPRALYETMYAALMVNLKPEFTEAVSAMAEQADPTQCMVRVVSHGHKKIQLIKAIREQTGWPLKEAKFFAEGTDDPQFRVTGTEAQCVSWAQCFVNISPGCQFDVVTIPDATPQVKTTVKNEENIHHAFEEIQHSDHGD